jgi:hypothetical protein
MTKIDDPNETQFRQVNPSWMEDDSPSRQAFDPTRKDDGKLSLDRSASTTAEQAHEDFTALGLRSAAVFGMTPKECAEDPNPIECYASPLENNPHHSHADFNGLTKSQRKKKSLELRRHAIIRGKLHP